MRMLAFQRGDLTGRNWPFITLTATIVNDQTFNLRLNETMKR